MKKSIRIIVFSALVLLLLLIAPAAQAELKATSAVYAWDRTALQYQNSNVVIYWDGGWVPFIHEIGFDNNLYFSGTSCPAPGTPYAGVMEFGLYHQDNNPAGAEGFIQTRNWQLVYCDRDSDGNFDGDDRTAQPPTGFTPYASLTPILQDEHLACNTGNCALEIITTLEVNMDTDCNGVIDTTEPICFFAEAQVPTTASQPIWQQTLQARVTAGGGDKTVSFNPRGPTAVKLLDLSARGASGLDMSLSLGALVLAGLVLVGVVFLRRGKPAK